MTLFSEIAVYAYLLTAALAFYRAGLTRDPRRRWRWAAVAVIFIALALWRSSGSELWAQTLVRNWTQAHGVYEQRQTVQIPITIGLLVITLALVGAIPRLRHAREATWALAAAVALVLVSALRAVSLHLIDAILYAELGPLHVNHVIDMGLTGVVVMLALADGGALRGLADRAHAKPRGRVKARRRRRAG